MELIVESTDHRLLDLIENGGMAAVGALYVIMSEMTRLGTATLSEPQWRRVLHVAVMLDRTDKVKPNDPRTLVFRIVKAGLLGYTDRGNLLHDADDIYSPAIAHMLEEQSRVSEQARKAANARWAKEE